MMMIIIIMFILHFFHPCFRTMAKSPAFLRFAVRLGSSVPQSLKPRAPDEHKRGGDLMKSNGM